MAIEQNTTITVGTGTDARTFGISKSLDQYTIDDLLSIGYWAYSAFNDSEMNANVYSELTLSGTMIDITEGQYASRVVCYPDNKVMSKGYNTNSEGVFFRNVLIYYDVSETNWVSSSVNVAAGRFPHYYVVTNIDLQDLVISGMSDPNAVASAYSTMKLGVNDVTIAPFQLYIDQNGELSLNMILPLVGGRSSAINSTADLICRLVSYGNWNVYNRSTGSGRNIKNQQPFHFFSPNHVDYPFQDSAIPGTQVLTDADKLIQCVKTDAPDTPAIFHYQYKTELMDKPYLDSARCGIRFKIDDTVYKPIVEDGMITGYTDDDTVTSEWDEWENIKDHVTPDHRPDPGPEGDKIDDMNINPLWAMSSDAGFARYFLLSHDQLDSLMTWLSDTTFPDGYDPYAYILSLLQFPLKLSPNWCMPRTPAGHITIGGEDTGITASLIANEKAWVGAGTYDVPELNGNFLDYDPYTQYELYIPCCGWVSLPDIVCGRKIAVKINYDLTTAAIIGNVYVTIDGKEMIVASKSGMMGRETIVTGEAQGVRSAQITSALLSAGTGALNVATGAISGNAVAAVSGGYNIVAGLAQANIASNSAYTRTIGSTGGRALLCQFDQCYLKICTTRADIPDNYGHTCGYVCNVSGKVSDFKGYTVFDNVDVSGIGKATDREKKLIKQILESGVIINPSEE